MYDAFISYSRNDRQFVNQLMAYLGTKELSCWLDQKDLPPAEIWRNELRDAIIDSDNFIFIISPHSVDSAFCDLEINWAVKNNKRIIPILFKTLRQNQKLNTALSERQWLRMDSLDNNKKFDVIASTIRNEQKWYKQGTEYLRGAQKWKAGKDIFLARPELEAARAWVEKGAGMNPGPSELQIKYIHESEAYHLKEAEKWEKLYTKSIARQLAAQGQLIIQHDSPALSDRGLLLAVESMARFQKINLRSLEADQAIRQGLSIMAKPLVNYKAKYDVERKAISVSQKYFTLAFADIKGHLYQWDLRDGKVKKDPALWGAVSCLKFSHDGRWLAVGGENGCLHLKNLSNNDVWTLKTSFAVSPIRTICFSRNGRYLAASLGINLAVWDINADAEPVELRNEDHAQIIVSMAFDPNGEILVAQPVMSETQCWDWRKQKVIGRFGNNGNHVEYSPDGRFLGISSAMSYTAVLWDVFKQESINLATNAAKLTFSNDHKYVAIASPEHFARIWKLPELSVVHNLRHNAEVGELEFSPKGDYLLTKDKANVVYVWNVGNGKQEARLVHPEPFEVVQFCGDSRYVFTFSNKNTFTLWETQHLREARLLRHQVAVLGVAFSPDNNHLIATEARQDQFKRSYALIDWTTEQLVEKVSVDENEIDGATYAKDLVVEHRKKSKNRVISPNGKLIAVRHKSGVQILTHDNEEEVALLQHDRKIFSMVFSPDSLYILTVSDHDTARIWELSTGEEVSRLTHDNPNITDADFSPDGRYIATSSWDLTARIWLWHPSDLIQASASRLSRILTEGEWKKYLPGEVYKPSLKMSEPPKNHHSKNNK
ncbi:WD40 repeat [Saccharicrinis carchari]|uniref:WD40 repeat n=1 Tax=Saccharicrinis carchari TaxID=1168039 RepID=A0A521EDB6_SACCC|nr:TIR domain-containing protein [Saccharicrinis carchari]SMO81923.1 WD40 repeat [Saccharicrinis carchari]